MGDLSSDIRLAMGTGKVSLGCRGVVRCIGSNSALAVVVATKGEKETVGDIVHMCAVSGTRLIRFSGNSIELGAACGRPHSVNSLAILEAGNSKILTEEY